MRRAASGSAPTAASATGATGAFQNFKRSTGLVYSSIRVLLLDRAGTLWVATDGGVSRIRSGRFVTDPSLDRLRGHRVWALHEDRGRRHVDRHAGRRALSSSRTARLTQFTIEHGLPSNKIHFIGEDRAGHLWMSGPSGVVSVSRADLEALRGTRLDTWRCGSTARRRAEHQSDDRRRADRRRDHAARGGLAAEHEGRRADRARAPGAPAACLAR